LPQQHSDPAALQLRAAKHVAWRGLGDLPQFVWARPLVGAWLVIDLWAGFSGLCLALLAMGTRFHAVAAENDPIPAQATQQCLSQVVAVDAVENVTGAVLRPFLQRRTVRGIILGGGSPCQGNSALNPDRKGLADVRSQQPLQLRRIREELEALPECRNLDIVTFLENVASMPLDVRDQYTEWVGFPPIVMDAAACGWVQRRRLLWLGCRGRGVSPERTPPDGWEWVQHSDKPIPAKVHCDGGFAPLFDASEVVRAHGVGAMHPFTREFWHPTDRVKLVAPEAAAKFFSDDRRFPPSAYEEASLLWRQHEWRQPFPEERCQMMGLPAQCLQAVNGPPAVRRQPQNSLIGNGFHLPMIVALFCLLPGALSSKIPRTPLDLEEAALKDRLVGTVWEPGRLAASPGLLSSDQVVEGMRSAIFSEFTVGHAVWHSVRQKLKPLAIWQLQAFSAWALGRGIVLDSLGPTPITRQHRAELFAGLTGQRYPGNSRKGLDHLLPPGLGKEQHMEAAGRLPSPFRLREWPDPDVDFVLHAVAVWRQHLASYSAQCRRVLTQVSKALQPLETALATFRCVSASRVAAQKRPGMMAFLTVMLRWPDLKQPVQMIRGYPIVGDVHPVVCFGPSQVGKLYQWLSGWGLRPKKPSGASRARGFRFTPSAFTRPRCWNSKRVSVRVFLPDRTSIGVSAGASGDRWSAFLLYNQMGRSAP